MTEQEIDIFKSMTDEEFEKYAKEHALTDKEIDEALAQGRKEMELFEQSIPCIKDSGLRFR
jgi:cytidylate kinase